jgi:hypothetical protein
MKIGKCPVFSKCGAVRKDGGLCTAAIDKSKVDRCGFHIQASAKEALAKRQVLAVGVSHFSVPGQGGAPPGAGRLGGARPSSAPASAQYGVDGHALLQRPGVSSLPPPGLGAPLRRSVAASVQAQSAGVAVDRETLTPPPIAKAPGGAGALSTDKEPRERREGGFQMEQWKDARTFRRLFGDHPGDIAGSTPETASARSGSVTGGGPASMPLSIVKGLGYNPHTGEQMVSGSRGVTTLQVLAAIKGPPLAPKLGRGVAGADSVALLSEGDVEAQRLAEAKRRAIAIVAKGGPIAPPCPHARSDVRGTRCAKAFVQLMTFRRLMFGRSSRREHRLQASRKLHDPHRRWQSFSGILT